MMGDYNYRYLEWPPTLDDHTISTDALQFYTCLEDNFLTQHVNFCTRNDAILDLILSDEPNVVQNVVDLGPFVSSDHNALSWNVEIRTSHEIVQKQTLDYSRADITSIKRELDVIDWNTIFEDQSADACWDIFKGKIEMLEDKFIPFKSCGSSRNKPLWMTHKARKAVSKKRQVYKKYKDATHPAYVQAKRQAKVSIKKQRKNLNLNWLKRLKRTKKSFFCIRQKQK